MAVQSNDQKFVGMTKNILLLLFLLPLSVSTAQPADSNTPYLYYFYEPHNAFVIERADGSDSRLLAEGVTVPEQHVTSAAWSPDGEWLAWNGSVTSYPDGSGTYIVHNKDQQSRVLKVVDDGHSFVWETWWKTESHLLLIHTHEWIEEGSSEPSVGHYRVTFALYDPVADEYSPRVEAKPYYQTEQSWSPDGRRFIIEVLPVEGTNATSIRFLHSDGSVERHEILRDGNFLDWYPDGRLMYFQESTLVLEDLDTDALTRVELPSGEVNKISLSPDAKYAVAYTRPENYYDASYDEVFGLITFEDQSVKPILDTVFRPEQLPNVSWSPDSQHVILTGNDGFTLYDVPSSALTSLPGLHNEALHWDYLEHSPAAVWFDNSRSVYLMGDTEFLRYDLASKAIQVYKGNDRTLVLSPDQSILLFLGNCIASWADPVAAPPCLLDQSSNTVTALMPHSTQHRLRYFYGGGKWHSSSEWVMVDERVNIGSLIYPRYSIASRDGSFQRELPGSVEIANWLPENVTTLPPALDQRLFPLPVKRLANHDTEVISLAWSPDGAYIASGDRQGDLMVSDTRTGETLFEERLPNGYGKSEITGIAWSKDGQQIAVQYQVSFYSGNTLVPSILLQPIFVIDVAKQIEVETIQVEGEWMGETLPANDFIISHASIAGSTGLVLVDAAEKTAWWRSGRYLGSDETYFRIDNIDSTFFLKDWITNNSIHIFSMKVDPNSFVYYQPLAISPDHRCLAMAHEFSDTIGIWDTQTGETILEIPGGAYALAFSPNMQYLAAASSYEVRIWSLHGTICFQGGL